MNSRGIKARSLAVSLEGGQISHELVERPQQHLPVSEQLQALESKLWRRGLAWGMDYFIHHSASSFEEVRTS